MHTAEQWTTWRERELPIMSAYIVMKGRKCSRRKKIYICKLKLETLEWYVTFDQFNWMEKTLRKRKHLEQVVIFPYDFSFLVISIHNLLNKETNKCYFRNSFWSEYVCREGLKVHIFKLSFLVTQYSWNQRRGFGSYFPQLAFVIQELKAKRNEADSSTEFTKGCNM